MRILISKRSVIWALCMILGVILLGKGILADIRYQNAISFSQLDINDFEYGTYIRGEITDFLKRDIYGNGELTGISMDIDGYSVYTVPVKDGAYVCVMVGGSQTIELLEQAANGKGASVSFEGKIVKPEFSPNYKWCGRIEGFDIELITADFVVKQISKKSITNTIYLGIDIIIIGLFLSLTGFAGETLVIDESEKERQKRKPVKSYNVENDIHSEQKKLAMLELQREAMQKEFRISLIFLAVSLLFMVVAPVEIKILGLAPAFLTAKECAVYWLNQPGKTASFLSGIFGVTPIHKRITECKEMIEKLERSRVKEEPIIMQGLPEEEEELALIEKGYSVRQEGND